MLFGDFPLLDIFALLLLFLIKSFMQLARGLWRSLISSHEELGLSESIFYHLLSEALQVYLASTGFAGIFKHFLVGADRGESVRA